MASYDTIINFKKIIYLILLGLPTIASTNIDCSGKPFHCVNLTHFQICVDLGGGVSQTIDDFVIPCPPTTECRGINHFECEYVPLTTTVQPVLSSSVRNDIVENVTLAWEKIDLTTFMSGQRTSNLELSEKYFNGLSITSPPTEITTSYVNTIEVITDSVYNNDNGTVITTPSYFLINNGSTDSELSNNHTEVTAVSEDPTNEITTLKNIATTETIVPTISDNPDFTLESITTPKNNVLEASGLYTANVEIASTETSLLVSEIERNQSTSTITDVTIDKTTSTYLEVFTPDTPFHEETTKNIELDTIKYETSTLRTVSNYGNIDFEITTSAATTLPDTILNSTTPYSGINITKRNDVLFEETSTPYGTVAEITTTEKTLLATTFPDIIVNSMNPNRGINIPTRKDVLFEETSTPYGAVAEITSTETTLLQKLYGKVPDVSPTLTADFTESTIDLKEIYFANQELKIANTSFSTGSTVNYATQTQNDANISVSKEVLVTAYDNPTTSIPVYSEKTTVDSTFVQSKDMILNELKNISTEQTPSYSLNPTEETITRDIPYFENSTLATIHNAATSEMVSDDQTEPTVTFYTISTDTYVKSGDLAVEAVALNNSTDQSIINSISTNGPLNQMNTNIKDVIDRKNEDETYLHNQKLQNETETVSEVAEVQLQISPLWNLTLNEKPTKFTNNDDATTQTLNSYVTISEPSNLRTDKAIDVDKTENSESLMSTAQNPASNNVAAHINPENMLTQVMINSTDQYRESKNYTTETPESINRNKSFVINPNIEFQATSIIKHIDPKNVSYTNNTSQQFIQNDSSTIISSHNCSDSSFITTQTLTAESISNDTAIDLTVSSDNLNKPQKLLSTSLYSPVTVSSLLPSDSEITISVPTSEDTLNSTVISSSILTTSNAIEEPISDLSDILSSALPSAQQILSNSEAMLGLIIIPQATIDFNDSKVETMPIINEQGDSLLSVTSSVSNSNDPSSPLVETTLVTNHQNDSYSSPSIVPLVILYPETFSPSAETNPVIKSKDNFSPSVTPSPIFDTDTASSFSAVTRTVRADQDGSKTSVLFLTSNSHANNSEISESPIANLLDDSETSHLRTPISSLENGFSSSPVTMPVLDYQDDSNLSVLALNLSTQTTSSTPVVAMPVINNQDDYSSSDLSSISTPRSASSSTRPITIYEDDFNNKVNLSSTSSSFTTLQNNSIPTLTQTPISIPHTASSSPVVSNTVSIEQDKSQTLIIPSLIANLLSADTQIPESPVTNDQDNSQLYHVPISSLHIASSTPVTSSTITKQPDDYQASTASSLISNPQSASYLPIPEIQEINLQNNSHSTLGQTPVSNPQTAFPSIVDTKPVTIFENESNATVILSSTSSSPSTNSQIPKSSGTDLQDNSNPTLSQTPIFTLHTTFSTPVVSIKHQEDSQTLIIPSIINNSQLAAHSPIPESPVTNHQDNYNPSPVQTPVSSSQTASQTTLVTELVTIYQDQNPHTSNSKISVMPVTNRSDNSYLSITPLIIPSLHTSSSPSDVSKPVTKQYDDSQTSNLPELVSNPSAVDSQIPDSLVQSYQDNPGPIVLPTLISSSNITPSPATPGSKLSESHPVILTESTSYKQLDFYPSVSTPTVLNMPTASNLKTITSPDRNHQGEASTPIVQSQVSTVPVTIESDSYKTFITPQTPTSSSLVLTSFDNNVNYKYDPSLSTSSVLLHKFTFNPVITSPTPLSSDIHQQKQSQTTSFSCVNKHRGRYVDSKDCRKFYVCIGRGEPIAGVCPMNTVFSELRKQCTKNLSHCVRENEFQCVSEGRFGDISLDNIYYICVRNVEDTYVRFKFQCQLGYHLNKTSVKCIQNIKTPKSTVSGSASIESSSKIDSDTVLVPEKKDSTEIQSSSDKRDFECEEEGKFAHPSNCRKYFICKKKKSAFRRKSKKCDSDEVFHKEKKKCVDADSYEC